MKKLYIILSLLLGFIIPAVTATAQTAADPPTANRYVSIHDSNSLWLKEGSTNAAWQVVVNNANGIFGISPTVNRLAYIDGNEDLWVKEGPASAQWQLVAHNIINAQLEGNEIFAITTDFTLMAKDGAVSAPWVVLRDNTYEVTASSNRIIVDADYDGTTTNVAVKEGGLYAPWVTVATPVSSEGGSASLPTISVTDTRIAYTSGDFETTGVKDGSLYSAWNYNVWGQSALNVILSGDRICLTSASQDLSRTEVWCKDSLNGAWVKVNDNGILTDVLPNQIAVYNTGPNYLQDGLIVLTGSLTSNGGWQQLDQGEYILFNHS